MRGVVNVSSAAVRSVVCAKVKHRVAGTRERDHGALKRTSPAENSETAGQPPNVGLWHDACNNACRGSDKPFPPHDRDAQPPQNAARSGDF
jgi:hypothetical protein